MSGDGFQAITPPRCNYVFWENVPNISFSPRQEQLKKIDSAVNKVYVVLMEDFAETTQ